MSGFVRFVRFVNLFCAAITAGGLVMILMALVPSKRNFSPNVSLQVHNEFDHHIDRYMRPSTATSGVTALLLIFLYSRLKRTRSALLSALGLGGTIGVVVTSEFMNVPTNKMLQTWSTEAVPANYVEVRDKWDQIHTVRTSCGLLALVSYIMANLAA